MRGPRHKRYLMLTSESPIEEEVRKELAHRMARISPALAKKAVWLGRALIVKTDNVELDSVRESLERAAGGVSLKSALTSGSIGKLKKAAPR